MATENSSDLDEVVMDSESKEIEVEGVETTQDQLLDDEMQVEGSLPPREDREEDEDDDEIDQSMLSDEVVTEAAESPEEEKPKVRNRRDVLKAQRAHNAEAQARRLAEEEFRSGWHSMDAAMKQHTVRYGVVASADPGETGAYLSVFVDGLFKVIVPFTEVYADFPVDMTTVDLSTEDGKQDFIKRQLDLGKKLIGVTIPIVIKEMHHGENMMDDYAIMGSRKDALTRLERANYASNRGATPLIVEGDIIDCDVISVGYHRLQVCAGGIDTMIRIPQLTHVYVPDARRRYKSGDKVRVAVREIKVNSKGKREVVLDGRVVELAMAKARQNLLAKDALVHAQITNVLAARDIEGSRYRNNRAVRASVYIERYNMPGVVQAFAPNIYGKMPTTGDILLCRVLGFNPYGYAVLRCTQVLGPSPETVV